jgi:hypothetical protein
MTMMPIRSVKPPSAHCTTNQKREAKQKLGARMKKATRPVASNAILMIVRLMATVHLPLGGNGFDFRARTVVSTVKTSCMYGTINMAGRQLALREETGKGV